MHFTISWVADSGIGFGTTGSKVRFLIFLNYVLFYCHLSLELLLRDFSLDLLFA